MAATVTFVNRRQHMLARFILAILTIAMFLNSKAVYAEQMIPPKPPKPRLQPYRTFLHVQRYMIENTGDPQHPIANVKIVIKTPSGQELELPGNREYWPIGNGQFQEINRIYELPWEIIKDDGFTFSMTMVNQRSFIKPCKFEVVTLSQFNRSYVCRVDEDWQTRKNIPPERLDKEAIQIRVFTDLAHTPKNQIPKDAIAIR